MPPMADRVRRRVRVRGRVQGVFFRQATATEARRLGLAGTVRNPADGTVEAVFEGPPKQVDEAVAFCSRGPADARVDGVEVEQEPAQGVRAFSVL